MFSYLLEHNRYFSLFGIFLILAVAFLFSTNKRKIKFRLIINALIIQFILVFFILKTTIGKVIFGYIARGVSTLYDFSGEGARFVFGGLADVTGPWGAIFAIKVIPFIVFFGALMAVLYHFGIIQVCVRAISFVIRPLLGTSGAETLCAVSNSVLGQTEAPLLVKNYLDSMTRSEILVVMVSGMATLSGAILAVYGSMGVPIVHLLSASIMAIPSSILISKILLPETDSPETTGGKKLKMDKDTKNVLDAVSRGTSDGLKLAVNVVAMLIAFLGLIKMIDFFLLTTVSYTLDDVFAKIFAPFAYFLSISKNDLHSAGALLGQKLAINEFVAYGNMVKQNLLPRSQAILTYALCGFSNFSCIGIQIGGIGALSPKKRNELIALGFRALLGGTLANLLNAAVASLFI